jgi:uncharacterized membrane protein YphA (DoxX/SURF4 family)
MLSLFPSLLTYEMLAPFILRLTLGGILFYWAYKRMKTKSSGKLMALGFLEGIVSLLLIIGLFTQAAALITLVILIVKLFKKIKDKAFFTNGVNYYFILFVIAVSLLFLGAGAFSFDLPL